MYIMPLKTSIPGIEVNIYIYIYFLVGDYMLPTSTYQLLNHLKQITTALTGQEADPKKNTKSGGKKGWMLEDYTFPKLNIAPTITSYQKRNSSSYTPEI